MSSSNPSFPVTSSIRQKLTDSLKPIHLDVFNESHMHNVPKNSETHFKVVVVSEEFEKTKSPLQRHRLVNGILADELDGPVHALSIVAKSPAQWEKSNSIPASPSCMGGDGSLPSK
jgi:stress-induced morphogen